MAENTEYSPGVRITLGSGRIIWRILHTDEQTKTMLLLAEEPIAGGAYHTAREDTVWQECGIRKWLNDVYLKYDTSLSCAVKTLVDGAEDTLFLLSLEEIKKYLPTESDRATSNGIWWWLRSPGRDGAYQIIVDKDGYIYENGVATDMIGGIRPAVRIPLDADGIRAQNQL